MAAVVGVVQVRQLEREKAIMMSTFEQQLGELQQALATQQQQLCEVSEERDCLQQVCRCHHWPCKSALNENGIPD